MADIVDPCCVPSTISGALTKPDKNNNTTANLDDGDLGIILPSEQCDLIEDGTDEKSESVSFILTTLFDLVNERHDIEGIF